MRVSSVTRIVKRVRIGLLRSAQTVVPVLGRYEMRAPFAMWLARQAAGMERTAATQEALRRYEVRQ